MEVFKEVEMVRCADCKKEIRKKETKLNMVIFFEKWSNKKHCMKAVKQHGDSLRYVKEPKVFEKIVGVKPNSFHD